MPESYMEKVITWPWVDTTGPATRRETRVGRGDAGGVIVWGPWRNLDISNLSGSQPPMETVRNYHGRIVATEVRDFNYSTGGDTAYAETTMNDNVPPSAPGQTGVVKEMQPNNYVKVTLNYAPPVDWQLVVNRRVKIFKYVSGTETLLQHNITAVAAASMSLMEAAALSSTGYTGHKVVVNFIDNHGNESAGTETSFDMFGDPQVPLKPNAPSFGGSTQVPGPEFGGQP